MDCHPPTRYFHTQSPCYLCWNVMQCTNPLHRTIQPRQNIENTKRSTKIKAFANCSACLIALESAASKNYSSLLYRTFYAYFLKNSIIGYFRKILVKIQAKMLGTSFVFTLATCKKISDNSSVPSSVLYGQFGPLRTIRSSLISSPILIFKECRLIRKRPILFGGSLPLKKLGYKSSVISQS